MKISGPFCPLFVQTLYALLGPDGQWRYVGRTSRPDPLERLRSHRYSNTAVGQWVEANWGFVTVIVLEKVMKSGRPRPGAGLRERFWIIAAREAGHDLFNIWPIECSG
jgi:hypothetical protein